MTKLYHPKKRVVREIADKDELRLRLLKRAGFKVGDLPDLPKSKQPVPEEALVATEVDPDAVVEEKVAVIAEHSSVEDLLDTTEVAPDVSLSDDATEVSKNEGEEFKSFSEMSMEEMQDIIEVHEIEIPPDIRSHKDVASFLDELAKQEIEVEEDAEEEEEAEEGEGDKSEQEDEDDSSNEE